MITHNRSGLDLDLRLRVTRSIVAAGSAANSYRTKHLSAQAAGSMYVHGMEQLDTEAESPFGPIRRITSIIVVIIVSFFVVVFFGFGAKTGCTNDASLLRLSEQPCEAIDPWAWAGLVAAALLAVQGYGGLVPSKVSEVGLGMAIIGVLAVACIAMVQVTAVS